MVLESDSRGVGGMLELGVNTSWNGAIDGVGVLLELRMMLEVGSPIGVRACYSLGLVLDLGWCWWWPRCWSWKWF